jgi:hypothetical protein
VQKTKFKGSLSGEKNHSKMEKWHNISSNNHGEGADPIYLFTTLGAIESSASM